MWKLFILIGLLCLFQDYVFTDDDVEKSGKRELAYLQILTTNGFYAPLSLYPNDENTEDDWPEGMGLLPKLGKLQQYEMGKYLRNFYDHFITSDPGEVDAFSSFEDRSTISLISFLASLYAPTKEWQFMPGFKWQPIVLCYMEKKDIFFSYKDRCMTQLEERTKILSSWPVREHVRNDEFLYTYWSENSGILIEDQLDVALLYDTIDKEQRAGLKVPRWARMYLDDMKRISDYAYTWLYNSTTSLQLKVGPLIDLLTVRMRVKTMPDNPDPNIVVSVYVTHDWNLAAVLSAMRLSNGLRPPPCATITFEMYKQDEEYTVRTLFFNSTNPEMGADQEPRPLVLDGCTEYCPLSNFVQFFEPVIPENHTVLCGKKLKAMDSESDEDDDPNAHGETILIPKYTDMKAMTSALPL
ncbi:Lysosomal acid phosphatase [Araneus ventricosus]|uniref:2-phosphoxylose phosphatase 1 n=1 Tax=Araneus ventricosus TaxID=182803 RepID=A0A4Y2G6A8_ARAVE|nr:Lysosomal acid phosphatase [Araneus ventricosus]